jgi:hypothetical protein
LLRICEHQLSSKYQAGVFYWHLSQCSNTSWQVHQNKQMCWMILDCAVGPLHFYIDCYIPTLRCKPNAILFYNQNALFVLLINYKYICNQLYYYFTAISNNEDDALILCQWQQQAHAIHFYG